MTTSGVDETSNVLIATRSCFRYTALDHLYTISLVQSKKRHEILDPVRIFLSIHFDITTELKHWLVP
jgi:hypothetical protein